jgi:hypothetical protein
MILGVSASLITLSGFTKSFINKVREWHAGISKPSRLNIALVVCVVTFVPIAVGVLAFLVSPIDSDGNRNLVIANGIGALCVAGGAVVEVVSRALYQRKSPKHETAHEWGLCLLGFGGVLLALRPIAEVFGL